MIHTNILLLPGDGVGPEICQALEGLFAWYKDKKIIAFNTTTRPVGGACYDLHGVAIEEDTVKLAHTVDTIFFGAVGGDKWSDVDFNQRPESGLLRLRKELELFANIRPAYCFPALVNASTLKPEVISGLDLIILRELTSGVYFGEPKEIRTLEDGQERACDNQLYLTSEIERVARAAFEIARTRRNKVSSVEKHNVMQTGVLWKKVVTRVHQEEYSDVILEHVLADNCAMQLVRNPKQFDVIVTDNLFGDILSDEAAMLTGSIGMLASASLGALDLKNGRRKALYEPVHGSAPDIAGKNIANPLAMVGSLALAFKYSFNMEEDAKKLNQAIELVLQKNIRTQDIAEEHSNIVGTKEMVWAIIKELETLYV